MLQIHSGFWLSFIDGFLAFCVLAASLFCLAAAVGMARFDYFFMRLHAPTKAATLGVGGLLIASMTTSIVLGHWHISELLITLFVFSTAPISAGLLAQAALHQQVPSKAAIPEALRPSGLHHTTTANVPTSAHHRQQS